MEKRTLTSFKGFPLVPDRSNKSDLYMNRLGCPQFESLLVTKEISDAESFTVAWLGGFHENKKIGSG